MTVDIICADARDGLARFPDGHFHCCVTSPPFWGLRDYGLEPTVWGPDCEHEWGGTIPSRRLEGNDWQSFPEDRLDGSRPRPIGVGKKQQGGGTHGAFCRRCNAWRGTLGLEPTPELYVEHLVAVMREVRRTLRDDGTCWLNLGDSYASGKGTCYNPGGGGDSLGQERKAAGVHPLDRGNKSTLTASGLKPKDLVGVPWMVAFALRADGWWLRQENIWYKKNPMPESCNDRTTRAHESMFHLTKRERYYYDQEAIREPQADTEYTRERYKYPASPAPKHDANADTNRTAGDFAQHFGHGSRNRRSVWEIATQPFPGAHFAVFPEKLVEPCILAGTSEWGCCPECGVPWERVVERTVPSDPGRGNSKLRDAAGLSPRATSTAKRQLGQAYQDQLDASPPETVGWRPTCRHGAEPVPCRVLDPFAGSGTVGLVAERLGRHSVLIDAKEEYCEMARHRTAQRGLMAGATSGKA